MMKYIYGMLGSMFERQGKLADVMSGIEEGMQAKILIAALQSSVRAGAANHRYNSETNTDEFRSTDRLIRNWQHVFPGDQLVESRDELFDVEMPGKRAKLFKKGWQGSMAGNPALFWPN